VGLKEELAQEMEVTRQKFHHLLDSVPEASYLHPSHNPEWTVGEVLLHIAIGMNLIHYEVWLTLYARSSLQVGLKLIPPKLLNLINAGFARRGRRITRQTLIKTYEAGHAGLTSDLKRLQEADLSRSVYVPADLEIIISGDVSIERLFRHVMIHFEAHLEQIMGTMD